MLIDFHTHVFPDKIAERAIDVLESNIVKYSGDVPFAHANYRGTLNGLKKSMSENHVDISVVLPIATNVTQSDSINRFAAELNKIPGIVSFGSLHPLQPKPEEELEKIKKAGIKGIKLHPEYQHFYINSPESIRILKYAEELGLFVVLHAGKDVGAPEPVHCSPQQLSDALGHVSGKNIIAAHMGGYGLWEDVLKYLGKSEIMTDTSFCLNKMPADTAKDIIRTFSPDRILFGTDSPWAKPSDILGALKNLNLTKDSFDKITFGNACRILGIPKR